MYDNPEEFIKEFDSTTIRRVWSVTLIYTAGLQSATMYFERGKLITVEAKGDDLAVVDGLTRRLAYLCGGLRLALPGMSLRRSGEVPHLTQLRARIGTVALVALTAAITAAVTVVVTKLLS
jgi:hypothetical protein